MADAFGGHPELWAVDPPPDQGPEDNVSMWREAKEVLDNLCQGHQEHPNQAVQVSPWWTPTTAA